MGERSIPALCATARMWADHLRRSGAYPPDSDAGSLIAAVLALADAMGIAEPITRTPGFRPHSHRVRRQSRG